MLLIVNADDLGTSQRVNDEIFALMDSGLITSATVIANAPAFQDAARRVSRYPNCSFGVHLNLTVFKPLSGAGGFEPILDPSGGMTRKLFEIAVSGDLREALLRELTAQVQRCLDAGVPVSHFDSHHHMHTIPGVFPVLKRLQRRFGIRRVRSTVNLLPQGESMTALRAAKKWCFRWALRNVYRTASPEGLGEFRDFHAALRAGRPPRFPRLELMVHPGTGDPVYEDELFDLHSDWQRLLPNGARLGNYTEV